MTEVPSARAAAQQPVNRGDLGRDFFAHAVGHFQRQHLLADGFGQTRGGFTGGRGQADAQGIAALHGRRLQQREQAHHGGGLAGAGAAGDDTECAPGGQGTGEFLPVDHAIGRRLIEQTIQALRQIGGDAFVAGQPQAQGTVDAPFISPVAAQIEAFSAQHQRAAPRRLTVIERRRDQTAGSQDMTPVGAVQPLEQLRRQQHRAGLQVAFGRQRQGKVRRLQGFEQIEAHMAVTQLMAGQCRRQ
ncbi:hypothetical protein [Pseudomonas sp. 31 R 17]|nr:hypothetical protein [Pseudomonas sp. 31 R 17]